MTVQAEPVFDAELLMQCQELVHVGTWVWDVRSDVVQWSDELFRLFGMAPRSIPLTLDTYVSRVAPADRGRVAGIIGDALDRKHSFEFDHRGANDERVFNSRGNVVCASDGSVIRMIGTCIDITERVRIQHALARSEDRFPSMFEQSAVGLALADCGGRFIRVNSSFAHFLGYRSDELQGRTFMALTHPDDAELTTRALQRCEHEGVPATYEKRYTRKDGTPVWGRATVTRLRNNDGSLDGYMAVVEDIAERKAASEALKHQTEVLQSILDHLPVMVSMYDADGRALYLNRAWQDLFGWTLEEAQTADILAKLYPDTAERARVRRAVVEGTGEWAEFEALTRDGHRVMTSWSCVHLSDGTSLRFGQDFTEQRLLQQRLLQTQKLEALGQLAGGVAHDFNNLLTIISACATFLKQDVREASSAAEDVAEIITASNRAAALTRQLLAFSRREMLKLEIIDVNSAMHDMARTLGRLVGENIELAIVPGASHATVEADLHQLEQVLLNLVVNGRDAIHDTGSITIETSNVKLPAGADDARDYVMLAVTDDGAGIEPGIRGRLFEPFFTTKPPGKGTGLGLATVHGIVEQCGGHIDVESTVGKGATFKVFLPVVLGECTVIGTTGTEELRGTETVLLVEDEAPLRAAARRVLTALGYSVLEARHGADGARLSATYAGRIDLLITDMVMPEMGGRELAALVRRQRPGVPVLYVSGYTGDELLRKGILESGAQLLRKPFLPADLARSVRELLRESLAAA